MIAVTVVGYTDTVVFGLQYVIELDSEAALTGLLLGTEVL